MNVLSRPRLFYAPVSLVVVIAVLAVEFCRPYVAGVAVVSLIEPAVATVSANQSVSH